MAKQEEPKSIIENQELLQEKVEGLEQWVERNPKIILGVVGVLVLIVGGYFGFRYWVDSRDAEAQKEMFQAVRYFEADSLNLAFKGDGNNLGFEQIIEDYKWTAAANLANYYAGVINLKQGKFQLAVFYLEDFSSDDMLVQARAYSLLGDAYMELKEYDQAAKYYSKASNHEPNKYFTPSYLMKEALAYEKLNQTDKAVKAYDRIINEFWDSSEFQNARKYKARLQPNS
jgi:tetratricopeptide (TPR) repeat protein